MLIDLYRDPDCAPYATGVSIYDAFPDETERAVAISALDTQGQYWTGAPVIVLVTSIGNKPNF